MKLTRRSLLATSALAAAFSRTALASSTSTSSDLLVVVILRGGMDALSLVPPYADPDYAAARPTLGVPAPGAPNGALDLDGFFGLHPAASALLPAWNDGSLAIVHAAGSIDDSRSHFDAFRTYELGVPGQPTAGVSTGWLARHLLEREQYDAASPVRAVALTGQLPRTLLGAPRCITAEFIEKFGLTGNLGTKPMRAAVLDSMYSLREDTVGAAGGDIIDAIGLLESIDYEGYAPRPGASYPASALGVDLKNAACLAKNTSGIEAITIEVEGWDHHDEQGVVGGVFEQMAADLADSLAAFHADTTGLSRTVTTVVLSEFGRRVAENGSAGTDHGHGGAMLLIGDAVNGGSVHGHWPGLDAASLDDGDLAVTTDYRDVLCDVLVNRCGATATATIFPGHTHTPVGVV
jgi:uncharacterized protein (DUF1501 family)